MAGCGCDVKFDGASSAYRQVLWLVIAINAIMFLVEMSAGLAADSMALQADALDFLADSATYGLSLYVIGCSLRVRSGAALFKGLSLGVLGLWVLGATIYRVFVVGNPEPIVMGSIGLLACAANVICVLLLLRFRNGDSNVRSVWLCSRNDAIGNLAVVLAAALVGATQSPWPDLAVAGIMASLFLSSSVGIVRQAVDERRQALRPAIDSAGQAAE